MCGQGRLYALQPGVELRIDGNALLSAIRYELEKLRCSACGEVFTAKLPDDAPLEKYSARARAVLAVGRYYLGLPFYRLERYQAMLGMPLQMPRSGIRSSASATVVIKCLHIWSAWQPRGN